MKALHIFATCASILSAVAVANPASAYWTHLIAKNRMTATPATPNGVGSEIGLAGSGLPTPAVARAGQPLASVRESGSVNTAAVTRLAARENGTQVATTGAESPDQGTLR